MTSIDLPKHLWRDTQFLAALLFAPVVWALLLWWHSPVLDLTWPLRLPVLFLVQALLYPVLEEIVFRGLIQEQAQLYFAKKSIGPISRANIVTSLLFSGMHFYNHAPTWAAAVFLPSLVFGYFKDRYHGLSACILLHIFYNSGYFWLFKV